MSFPRYPKYKPSGVDWLGDVPAHWLVAALAYRYRVELGKMLDAKQISGDHLRPYVRNADVQWGKVNVEDLNTMDFEPDERDRFRLRSGDLLVCEGGEVGRCAVWTSPIAECYYQKAIHRLRPVNSTQDDAMFLRWVLDAAVARGCFASAESKATIAHLPAETFRRHRFPFPPLPEQRAIAAFLDRETAKIDGLVAEQRRLIELLKEKRQAVVSHAVTKGLDPKAPMKPSGVEWLGDVPAHWEVKPLMYLTPDDRQIMYGIVLPGPDVDVGVPIVKGGDVAPGRLTLAQLKKTTFEIEAGYARSRLAAGDIVYSIRGSIGEAELVPAEIAGANITQDAARIAPRDGVHAPWLLQAMRSSGVFSQLDATASGATIRGINIFNLKRARIPVPPAREQKAIAAALQRDLGRFDDLASGAQHAVELLQERRSALISAAVTGQIDVRNAAATEAA